ncbi:MAG: hypothetical protein ACE5SW_10870 [Nitrososphaeraceae archaeon]
MNNNEVIVPENGIVFIYISISILVALIISSLFFNENSQFSFYVLTWLGSFLGFFIFFKSIIVTSIANIKKRIKKSIRWPTYVKILNGLCWAAPFAFGIFIPNIYEYLVLLAVALGNISTFLIFLKFNSIRNLEQLLVGFICILSIFIIMLFYHYDLLEKIQGDYLARFFIAISFGIGGIYSFLHSKKSK